MGSLSTWVSENYALQGVQAIRYRPASVTSVEVSQENVPQSALYEVTTRVTDVIRGWPRNVHPRPFKIGRKPSDKDTHQCCH